ATIIGTPPNVAYVGFMRQRYDVNVEFSQWFLLCAPIALLLMLSLYFVMTKILFPNRLASDPSTGNEIRARIAALGPLKVPEKRVLVLFISTATLWVTKDLINAIGLIRLEDTIIAVMGATAMFICPSGAK